MNHRCLLTSKMIVCALTLTLALIVVPAGAEPTAAPYGAEAIFTPGAAWEKTDGPHGGVIFGLAVNSNGDIFALTEQGEVFRTLDNGANWSQQSALEFQSLAISPADEIFCGVTSGNGVYHSVDNGDTWALRGLAGTEVTCLAIDPTSGAIYAANYSGEVYRSFDNGVTWTLVTTGLTATDIQALAIDPTTGDIFVGDISAGVYYSNDDGTNWFQVNTGLTNTNIRALTINSAGNVFAGTAGGGVFRTINSGGTWAVINTGIWASTIQSLAINATGDIFAGTSGLGVFVSINNGGNWTQTNLAAGYIFTLALNPFNGDIVAAGYGGVFRTSDKGTSWTEINYGLQNTEVVSLAVNSSDHIFAGSNGGSSVYRTTDDGDNWTRVGLLNSAVVSLTINSSDHIFAGTGFSLYRSLDNGTSWLQVGNGLSGGSHMSLAINSTGTIFVGTNYDAVWKSTDNGTNFTAANAGLPTVDIKALAINSGNDVFAGTAGNGVYRSVDNGVSWAAMNSGLVTGADLYIVSLAIAPSGDIFAATFGGVFRSTDNGATWSPANTGLGTSYYVWDLAITSTGDILAGNALGAYLSTNNGNTWSQENTGLSFPYVSSLVINSSDRAFVGTYGGGVFREAHCYTGCAANGDANNDGISLTVADMAYLAEFINAKGSAPIPLYSCDLNGDGFVDANDLTLYQNYFIYGMSVFGPYGGYPVCCPCNPVAVPVQHMVSIFGLQHSSAGGTYLEDNGGQLVVSRFLSPSPSGVEIDIPDEPVTPSAGVIWRGELLNPDLAGTAPIGAMLEVIFTFSIVGQPEPFPLGISQTKAAPNTWDLAVESEAGSYTVKAYYEDTEVFVATGLAATSLGYVVEPAKAAPEGVHPVGFKGAASGKPSSLVATADYDFTASPGGVDWSWSQQAVSNLAIDYLRVIPEMDSSQSDLDQVAIYAEQLDAVTITSEELKFDFGDVVVAALGNATITGVGTTLIVSNIGSSGLDGFEIDAEAEKDDGDWSIIEIVMENPNLDGTLPVGASVDVEYLFAASTGGGTFPMESFFDYAGSDTWNLGVTSDSGLYTVTAYNDDAEVFTASGVTAADLGSIVESAKALPEGVHPVGFKGAASGKPSSVVATADYDFTASPGGAQWSWPAQSVSNLTIDYLSVSLLIDPTLTGISNVAVRGYNGGVKAGDPISLSILDIVTATGCCEGRVGDANNSLEDEPSIGDVAQLVDHLFIDKPPLVCVAEADINQSGGINPSQEQPGSDITIGDVADLINYLFIATPAFGVLPDCL